MLLHENSMLSGEICGVAWWNTFTLRAFPPRFNFGFPFLHSQSPTQNETWNWKTPTEALPEKKKSCLKSQWLFIDSAFCNQKDIITENSRSPCDALKAFFAENAKFSNWKSFMTNAGSAFSGKFLRAMNNGRVKGKTFNAPKMLFNYSKRDSVGKISSDLSSCHGKFSTWHFEKAERREGGFWSSS